VNPLIYLMASLKDHTRNNPAFVAAVGAVGGLGGGFIAWLRQATDVLQFVSVFFGSLVAIGAFLLALPKIIRLLRNIRTRGIVNADRDSEPPFTPTK
jgi:hypothetical protein